MMILFKKTRCFAALQIAEQGSCTCRTELFKTRSILGNTATGSNTRTCCQSATYPSHALLTLPLFVKDSGMQVVSLNEMPT